ncbi:MAG: RNA polymerase sigma-70 factor, partial [Bacteroidetes bacterium]|nr:RNA polymerase sigma-70 factor [Bacteroidota bacterium]
GDEAAFTTLFFQYTGRLAAFITQLLQSDQWAEEIVQDVFMRLWQNRKLLRDVEHPSAYLYQMASNRTLDYIKKNAREVRLQYYVARRFNPREDANSTEEELDFREIEKLLGEATSRMPAQRRRIYQMVREEGLSHAEIAERLNISKHTVRNHMADALREIREYFMEHGVLLVFMFGLLKE